MTTTLKNATNWVIYYYYLFLNWVIEIGKDLQKSKHKTQKIVVKVTFRNGKGYLNKSNVGKKRVKKNALTFLSVFLKGSFIA